MSEAGAVKWIGGENAEAIDEHERVELLENLIGDPPAGVAFEWCGDTVFIVRRVNGDPTLATVLECRLVRWGEAKVPPPTR